MLIPISHYYSHGVEYGITLETLSPGTEFSPPIHQCVIWNYDTISKPWILSFLIDFSNATLLIIQYRIWQNTEIFMPWILFVIDNKMFQNHNCRGFRLASSNNHSCYCVNPFYDVYSKSVCDILDKCRCPPLCILSLD